MDIILRSSFSRRLMMVIEIVAFSALATWPAMVYVAEAVAQEPTVRSLRLAVRLDSLNSDYHLRLARLLRFSLREADPDQAVAHLRRARELNPRDPEPWLNLGSALEAAGKTDEGLACLARADALAPNHPGNQWTIGNAFLLHGNVDEAFRHFKVVLAGTSDFDQILFSTAWKASGDGGKILQELIPHQVRAEFAYLYYLVSTQRYPEAQNVWKRIRASSETFPPGRVAEYMDQLIATVRSEEAYQVWNDLRTKGIIPVTFEQTDGNLLINGDFEDKPLNLGFDWRFVPLSGVETAVDDSTYRSPGHSFLVEFSGKENVDYHHVFQFVRVVPGRHYRLHGYMKTEKITTDSGPRLEVRDAYHPGLLAQSTDDLKGSSTSWVSMTLNFTPGPRTDLIRVGVSRIRSRRFDSLISGRVWFDDFTLTEARE